MKLLAVLSFFGVILVADFQLPDVPRHIVDHIEVLRVLDAELSYIINK